VTQYVVTIVMWKAAEGALSIVVKGLQLELCEAHRSEAPASEHDGFFWSAVIISKTNDRTLIVGALPTRAAPRSEDLILTCN
jgi:hypothetical protein